MSFCTKTAAMYIFPVFILHIEGACVKMKTIMHDGHAVPIFRNRNSDRGDANGK